MTTPAACSGDHSAGSSLGDASGAQGKAKAPPSGQTLLESGSGVFGLRPLMPVVRVAPEKLLGEVGKIVGRVMFGARGGAPRRWVGHEHFALIEAKQMSTLRDPIGRR